MKTYSAGPINAEMAEDLPEGKGDRHMTDTDTQADNTTRAMFACAAVQAYAKETGVGGESPYLAITDLLGDLMHLVDALNNGENPDDDNYKGEFTTVLENAYRHYDAEVHGEL